MTYVGYVSLVPCYWVGLMLFVAGATALVTPKARRNTLPIRIASACVGTTIIAWIALAIGVDRQRMLTATARWEIRDDANVRLLDAPPAGGGGWTVYSPELVTYLRERNPDRVAVTFPA